MDCAVISETTEVADESHVEDRRSVKPPVPIHEMQQGRSQRERCMPKYLENYEMTFPPSISPSTPTAPSISSTLYPMSQYVSYDNFSSSHQFFLTAITSHDEPKTFKQAIKYKH